MSIAPPRLAPELSGPVIDALGGSTATARIFGIAPQNASTWRRRGIPAARVQFLQERFRTLPAVQATLGYHPWQQAAAAR